MRIIGHRGSGAGSKRHGLCENTLPSFQHALKSGADEVECDLALTKDHRVVIHHDENIRAKGRHAAIAGLTYEELTSLFPDLTTLETLLSHIEPPAVTVELKAHTNWPKILDVLVDSKMAPGGLRFISFEASALKDVKKRWPQAYCSFIATSIEANRMEPFARAFHVELCEDEGFDEISGHHLSFSKRISDMARERKIVVGLGMIDSALAFDRAKHRGAERLYSNRVDWLRGQMMADQKTTPNFKNSTSTI